MPKKNRKRVAPKKSPILRIALIAAVVVVLLSSAGFAFAASQEQNDAFCSSCHTQPESTFYQRSTTQPAVDLASFHRAKNTACIDCHSGIGITGRLAAEMMGARNAAAWFSGTAVQPAPLNFPIPDSNCLKCHSQVTAGTGNSGFRGTYGPQGHYHRFLQQWQAQDPKAASCVSCHNTHATSGNANAAYINNSTVVTTCEACHNSFRN